MDYADQTSSFVLFFFEVWIASRPYLCKVKFFMFTTFLCCSPWLSVCKTHSEKRKSERYCFYSLQKAGSQCLSVWLLILFNIIAVKKGLMEIYCMVYPRIHVLAYNLAPLYFINAMCTKYMIEPQSSTCSRWRLASTGSFIRVNLHWNIIHMWTGPSKCIHMFSAGAVTTRGSKRCAAGLHRLPILCADCWVHPYMCILWLDHASGGGVSWYTVDLLAG
jgi:hypothetical protein